MKVLSGVTLLLKYAGSVVGAKLALWFDEYSRHVEKYGPPGPWA
jgi:hypothetical protein